MNEAPAWRRVYDAVEREVTPRVEALVRTPEFAQATAWAAWARSAVNGGFNTVSARMWHLVNLPAGTDVQRLRAQIGALDREVRRLNLQLEQRDRAGRRKPPSGPDPKGA